MAKTIKFNLICDGKPVRTLEDLRNNFSIEDIVKYYNNKLLQCWLNVRGYENALKKVEAIKTNDTLKLVKELISIFGMDSNPVSVEENTYILQYKKENEFLLEEYKKIDFKVSTIVDVYHNGYRELIETILENKNDIAKIKAAVKEIIKKYRSLYELDYRRLFYKLLCNAPLAVFVMIMHESMREKYLPIITIDEDKYQVSDVDKDSYTYDSDKRIMYKKLCQLVSSDEDKLYKILGDNLKSFASVTDGYWKDVEPKGKKYMILKMEAGNYVRNSGEKDGDLGSSVIKYNFVILDGIDYKSDNSSHELFYMEV